MSLQNKRVAMFVEDMYEDLEFWYPYYRMKEAGAEVTVIGPEKKDFEGKHGLPAKADKSINEVNTNEFDALIIPGGYSPDRMRRSQAMVDFTRMMAENGKITAAVCHAPWMLASAGVIEGKRVTSFFSLKDDLINAGAEWLDREVVVDGPLITSRNPDDLPAFCRAIIEHLD
ncbi:MAG TPA: type 1 glutamine amidotransferase domain-containing protein [Anaerolineae bacterium]|nr:type 1 glutamine amidotransferase domain-containing protein [Anaerolineae bacterium]HMR67364.1 type 1 glutamine amidotransferase domain-containing protein [Anaerolineae bacterium]